MNPFSAIPFFRILIPFIAGILIAVAIELPQINILCFLLLPGLIGLAIFYNRSKRLVLLLADVFFLLYGASLVRLNDLSKNDTFYGNVVSADSAFNFVAVINELPVEKEKTTKCELKILQVKAGDTYKPASGTVIAYFKRPVLATLKAGATVLVKTKLLETPPPQNPFEFDYKTYLQHKQIYHIAFIDSGSFVVLPFSPLLNPVWKAGLVCKKLIMDRLKNSALSKDAYNICCALLTGYDDEIDRPVMDAFSHSGTLHVLSVSGLHTGLIYLVLSFLFDLFDPHRKYRLLKFSMVTVVLWLFALITGFSAPVLRAVLMFNLFGLGSIYFRNDARNQFNILLVSAFILLCYNPFFITDVGFLLSYFALAGLIYFQPKLAAMWQPPNRPANYVWQSITASVAATLSTLPLTLFYFKQFPFWFFVCNLVVVPATFIILFLAVLVVVLKLNVAALITNALTAGLIAFINVFNSDRFGFADKIHFVFTDVACLTLVIVLVSAAVYYRSYRLTIVSLIAVIAWQFVSLLGSFQLKQEKLFSVYQLKHKSVLSVKNKTGVCLSYIDSANYNFHVKPHIVSFNYPAVVLKKFNYVRTATSAVLILDTLGYWPALDPGEITTLVLANDFKLTFADLQRFKQLKTIVADGSNNNFTIKKAEELSRKFGVNFYNTKRKGAYLLTL